MQTLAKHRCFEVEGLLTHYSRADDDADFTAKQVRLCMRYAVMDDRRRA
jgi:hypothetical protein